jgi:LysM repeat protein
MPPQTNRSLTRLAAPIALVVVAIAFLFVLASSGTDGGDGDKASQTTERTSTERAAKKKAAPRRAATYTVKTGDTLGAIAEKTGVDVEELQTLNPELDPQALVSGQKIKLRE